MKIAISLFLILMIGSAFGQNLVPNGDFESHGDCSEGASFSMLNDWFWPEGGGSSDYFNACSNDPWPNSGVPSNIFGFQNALSGNGYVGFGTYEEGWEVREYIRVELESELIEGVEYCLSFFLSWADSSSYKSKHLHAIFKAENDWINQGEDQEYSVEAQIVFDDIDDVDESGWKFFSKSFVAGGGEKFLTIGNFFDSEEMDLTFVQFNQIPYYSYYFIEDLSLSSCASPVDDLNQSTIQTSYDPKAHRFYLLGGQSSKIQIFDLMGKLVYTQKASSNMTTLELSYLTNGIYIVVVSGENILESIKIIKS